MPNFKDYFFTLEQNKATIMTDNRLQDLTMTTAEKDAAMTALLYVSILRLITKLQTMAFFAGI
jgi:hypothetical protein